MFIFPVVVAVTVLVTLGYLCLWSSAHEKTSNTLAGFGRVMAITLFVLAGLGLLFGVAYSGKYCPYSKGFGQGHGYGMMGGMQGDDFEGYGMYKKTSMMNSKDKKEMMRSKMGKWQKDHPKEFGECMSEMKAK